MSSVLIKFCGNLDNPWWSNVCSRDCKVQCWKYHYMTIHQLPACAVQRGSSWILMFRILNFHDHPFFTIVLTCHISFRQIKMRKCDSWVSTLQSSTIVQITLSSVKLHISLSEVNCLYILRNETLLPSINIFCDSLGHKQTFTPKVYTDVCDGVISANKAQTPKLYSMLNITTWWQCQQLFVAFTSILTV